VLSIVTQPDHDAVVRVRVGGELDMGTAGQVNTALRQALRERPGDVLIDLGPVSFLDSSGICALLIACQNGEGCAATVRVVNAGEQVLRVLEITGVRSLLEGVPPTDGDTPRRTA
jgi:anti-sigma B factor antagonist